MAVYDEHDGKQWIAFYTSPDLKKWTFASRIEGFFECPDLFELPVDGDAKQRRSGCSTRPTGSTSSATSTASSSSPIRRRSSSSGTATSTPPRRSTTARPPGSRTRHGRIQIGWGQGVTFPGMPFNQQMTTPVYLLLCKGVDRGKPGELFLTANPVHELWGLRRGPTGV